MSSATHLYQKVIRPVLFRLPAETAHELGKTVLRRPALWRALAPRRIDDPRLRVDLGGIQLRSPVGLAAGFDKNSEMLATFNRLDFGYAIPGSIRDPNQQDGPRPNIVRNVAEESLVNCTGLPSKGGPYAAPRLAAYRQSVRGPRMAVIPSISGFSVDEYVRALEAIQPHVDGVEIVLLCPNEKYEETNFLEEPAFRSLLTELNARKQRPFFVKIRNYHDPDERLRRLRLIELCVEVGVEGVTLPGSMTVTDDRLSFGVGNMSGRAVLENTIRNVGDVRHASEGRVAIKALGGISTAQDAYRAIAAGATTVELLTGLVYQGWGVAAAINAGLLRLIAKRGFANLDELRGSEAAVVAPKRGVAQAVA